MIYQETNRFHTRLQKIKDMFDAFDAEHSNEEQQKTFIDNHKETIFAEFTEHFNKIWNVAVTLGKKEYEINKKYYQKMLGKLFLEEVSFNQYIFKQPLGYAGDFVMMDYIYEYCVKYVGSSSYEKLVNHYACNVPISKSNIGRKDFIKKEITALMEAKKDRVKVMTIGCGPARELVELLQEDKIKKPLIFKCIDFEKNAINFIRKEIDAIEIHKKIFLTIDYMPKNILSLIRDAKTKAEMMGQDLIYCSGVFDYLNDKISARLFELLFGLLNNHGRLFICNANKEKASHQASYEMMGDWVFIHKTRDELLSYAKNIKNAREILCQEIPNAENYLYLSIRR